MVFIKAILAAFNPFGFLKNITLKGWLTIGAIVVLIGFGFLVRYYWNDYHQAKKDVVVKEEQNKQLEATNHELKDDSDKKDQSEELNNIFSDLNFLDKVNNTKKYNGVIKQKNDELKQVPLVTPEEVTNDVQVDEKVAEERAIARSTIRWNNIQRAYCLTQPDCKDKVN